MVSGRALPPRRFTPFPYPPPSRLSLAPASTALSHALFLDFPRSPSFRARKLRLPVAVSLALAPQSGELASVGRRGATVRAGEPPPAADSLSRLAHLRASHTRVSVCTYMRAAAAAESRGRREQSAHTRSIPRARRSCLRTRTRALRLRADEPAAPLSATAAAAAALAAAVCIRRHRRRRQLRARKPASSRDALRTRTSYVVRTRRTKECERRSESEREAAKESSPLVEIRKRSEARKTLYIYIRRAERFSKPNQSPYVIYIYIYIYKYIYIYDPVVLLSSLICRKSLPVEKDTYIYKRAVCDIHVYIVEDIHALEEEDECAACVCFVIIIV